MKNLNYKTYAQMATDVRNAIIKIPRDIDLIVGNPRSGMIPAYMIGSFLNLPVCTLGEYLNDIKPMNGERLIKYNKDPKKILVVDDSACSGNTFNKIRKQLEKKVFKADYVFFAVYVSSESKNIPDVYASVCELPRIFQWNYLYHDILSNSCFDIDGVLCVDPTEEENDDGNKYLDFIRDSKPLYIPNYKIRALVTSRLEKYRKHTEEWLFKHNVLYDYLYMLDLPTKEERIRRGCHGKFKAEIYSKLDDCVLFVESEISQAIEIAELAKKPVICLSTDEFFAGGDMSHNVGNEQKIENFVKIPDENNRKIVSVGISILKKMKEIYEKCFK